ncbi:MAG: polysaccharide biosynthesis/export family protein [Saprospiraceae bacterium]
MSGQDRQLTTDNRQLTTDNRQLTTDNRQLTTDNRQLTTDNRSSVTRALQVLTVLVSVTFLVSGCVRHKELVNFNEAAITGTQAITADWDLTIEPEDLLRITVHSFDPVAAQPFNLENIQQPNNQMMMQQQAMNGSGNQMELFTGYFVDLEGMIDFPVIGRVAVGGLTLDQAKDTLYTLIKPYLRDATINIRMLNFKVTVLGEVNQPGTLRLTNKRITLLEALGMAGDLSPYANRERILVIREKGEQREMAYINLRSSEIFTSPYFYLQQNDVIYVEPGKAKVAVVQDPVFRWIGIGSAGISLIALIASIAK